MATRRKSTPAPGFRIITDPDTPPDVCRRLGATLESPVLRLMTGKYDGRPATLLCVMFPHPTESESVITAPVAVMLRQEDAARMVDDTMDWRDTATGRPLAEVAPPPAPEPKRATLHTGLYL
jgi:hypothetical protein